MNSPNQFAKMIMKRAMKRAMIMKTARTELFQIPFKKSQIKRDLSGIKHCVLKSLAILSLRKRSVCIHDTKTMDYMYDIYDEDPGICNEDIAHYLSTIFETSITYKTNYDDKLPYLDLMNGHATLVSVGYKKDNEIGRFVIIVYKYNNVIYCYDPIDNINTTNINKIMKTCNVKKFENYECFYTNSRTHTLNKRKIVAPIRY
uniref:Uncharacterized protein n=1 Tax=viral metagenome TaxID=1070528 RepID=A0A6C0D3X2_9ZZZZ